VDESKRCLNLNMLKEQMNNNEVKYVVFSPSCMNMFVFMFTVC